VALVLLFIAIAAIVLGVRGQAGNASTLLAKEFTGAGSFIPWFLALMLIGAIGFWKPAKPFADGFLGLVLLALFLDKANPNQKGGGFFAQLQNAFATATATPAVNVAPTSSSNPGTTATNVAASAAQTAAGSAIDASLLPNPSSGVASVFGGGIGNAFTAIGQAGASIGQSFGNYLLNGNATAPGNSATLSSPTDTNVPF
jgi:hypothetical protein